MKGKHKFVVSNRSIKYEFEIKRNITIIQGDSATGKTVLLNMLAAYSVDHESSGIKVICDVPVFVYSPLGAISWQEALRLNEGSIVFIEEDFDFVSSTDFAEYLEHSDSYFVIVTREDLENLPYSVEEIYRIKDSGKYGTASQVYNVFENVYVNEMTSTYAGKTASCIITEDSRAGFQFWKVLSDRNQKKCLSAFGKSNVVKCMRDNRNEKLLVIVDGAAFGSQMQRLKKTITELFDENCVVFIPESFEWVLLKAELIQNIPGIQNILVNTYDYLDSKEYMSWERFFYALIVRETAGKPYQYLKNTINEFYTGDAAIKKVRKTFPVLDEIYTK